MIEVTRRGFLAGAVGAIASLRAADPPSPVMTRLSAYMSAAQSGELPAEVIEKTKQMILDTLAAMISGTALPPGRVAIQFARAHGGERVATVAGSNLMCGAD